MTRTLPRRDFLCAAPLCAALGACLWAAPAAAQSAPRPAPSTPSATPPAPEATPTPEPADDRVEVVTQGGRRVYVSHRDIVVPGERQRPYAFAVTGRGPLGYTAADASVHFVDEIAASARRAPF